MSLKAKKIISIALIVILLANMTLLALKIIGPLLFWTIIIAIAMIAWWVMPKLDA